MPATPRVVDFRNVAGTDVALYDVGDDFWEQTHMLRHIYVSAKTRRVNPWAVLGILLVRVLHYVPRHVQLPNTGGSRALNMFVAAVGSSGLGKGAAMRAAEECLDGLLIHDDRVTLGSGEGVTTPYRRIDKSGNVIVKRNAALIEVHEGSTMAQLSGRQGATLLPELCKAWAGEPLGFQNRDDTKSAQLKADEYRMGLVMGIQPEMAGPLMKTADIGLAQRFLYVSVIDPDMTSEDQPPPPDPMSWRRPRFEKGVVYPFPIPEGARRELTMNLVARHRGDTVVDRLDAHWGQVKLKAAIALAVLHGRMEVTDEEWAMASDLMVVHKRTRDELRARVDQVARREAVQRGKAFAHSRHAERKESARLEEREREQIGLRILQRIPAGGIARNKLMKTLGTKRLKDNLDAGLDWLIENDKVEVQEREYRGRVATRYVAI
jgi:hypothetical protein